MSEITYIENREESYARFRSQNSDCISQIQSSQIETIPDNDLWHNLLPVDSPDNKIVNALRHDIDEQLQGANVSEGDRWAVGSVVSELSSNTTKHVNGDGVVSFVVSQEEFMGVWNEPDDGVYKLRQNLDAAKDSGEKADEKEITLKDIDVESLIESGRGLSLVQTLIDECGGCIAVTHSNDRKMIIVIMPFKSANADSTGYSQVV